MIKITSGWGAVWALALAAFVFNTTEFIPIGLLSSLAADFYKTEAQAGLIVTAYAWVVLIASLPLMLIFSKVGFKKLLLPVVGVFVIAHVCCVLAVSFDMLLCARILVALCHALFWSIATPLAVKVAPQGKRSLALSLVVTGTAAAMIAGMPLGRLIGLYLGWRTTFGIIGVIALLDLLWILKSMPAVPADANATLKALPKILSDKILIGLYAITALIFTAHYIGYSYIEPYLAQVAGLSPGLITLILILMGCSGILGSIIFSKLYDKKPDWFLGGAIGAVMLFMAMLQLTSLNMAVCAVLCLCWGLGFCLFGLTLQAMVISAAPQFSAIAMAIYSSICNLGIGMGALLGSHIINFGFLSLLGWCGALLALGALIYGAFIIRWRHELKNPGPLSRSSLKIRKDPSEQKIKL